MSVPSALRLKPSVLPKVTKPAKFDVSASHASAQILQFEAVLVEGQRAVDVAQAGR